MPMSALVVALAASLRPPYCHTVGVYAGHSGTPNYVASSTLYLLFTVAWVLGSARQSNPGEFASIIQFLTPTETLRGSWYNNFSLCMLIYSSVIHDLVDGGCRKTTPFQFISLAVVLISSDRVEYQLHRDHILALAAYLHLQALTCLHWPGGKIVFASCVRRISFIGNRVIV